MRKKCFFPGLAMTVAILAIVTNAHAFHPDLIAAWTFDEGEGETTADATGNGHEGVLVGSPKWVDGVNGKALEIMGNTQYVMVEDSADLHFGEEDFTFVAWVNIDNYGGGTPSGIISKRTMVTGDGQPTLLWVVDNEVTAVEVQIRDNVGAVNILTGEEVVAAGEWHHVAVVKTDVDVTFYVDGLKDVSLDHGFGGSFTAEDHPLYIGVHHYGTTWNCSLNGKVDEVAIFSKALSGTEIASVMKSLISVEASGKTETYWGHLKSLY